MSYDIGPQIGIEGEKNFKNAVAGINKDMAVLASELGKVTAQFDGNADSMEALTAKQKVYNAQVDEQKKKIETLKDALANSIQKYGEADTKTKNWQISLNKAEAELAKTERSLKDTTDRIDNFGNEAADGGNAIEKAGKKAKGSGYDAEKGNSGWDKLGEGLTKVGKMAGKAVVALGAAVAGAATGVAAMTTKAAQSADEINTLAKQTGLSTEAIQKFQYASELIDVPMDTLTGSMAKLTKNMATASKGTGDANAAFKALGVAIIDSNGELRNNQDVFNDAINALGKMENGTQRDAYAMQIFGKSAQDLNPLILGGADALKTLGDEAEAAGLILSQDSLDDLNSFSDAMDTFKATLSGSGSLFATAFAGPMAKGLNTITGYLQDMSKAFNSGGFGAMSDKLGEILADAINKITENMPKIIELGLNIVKKLVEGISQNIPALMEGATTIMMQLVNALLDMLPELLKMGLEIIKELALGIANALLELIPAIVDTVTAIVDGLLDNIDMLIEAALKIIVALAAGLIQALPKLI
jgi:phage-related protein